MDIICPDENLGEGYMKLKEPYNEARYFGQELTVIKDDNTVMKFKLPSPKEASFYARKMYEAENEFMIAEIVNHMKALDYYWRHNEK